jgi:hypothetical protein
MGALQAIELANDEFDLGLENSIGLHLKNNHYPSVPSEMVSVCIDAIDAVNSEGDWEKLIKLPSGISWKGSPIAPAYAIVEQHHLEFWIIESELE